MALATALFGYGAAVLAGDDELPTMGEIKRWTLQAGQGTVRVKLSRVGRNADEGLTTLSIEPDAGVVPSAAQEAGMVEQALREMPVLGYKPHKLVQITTWLQRSELRSGAEQAVAESGLLSLCAGKKYCHEAEPAVNRYFDAVVAFRPFDQALTPYGLKRESVRMDDMSAAEVSGHVVCSGLIVIALGERR